MRLFLTVFLVIAIWSDAAHAQGMRSYCAAAKAQMKDGSPLAKAAGAVFPDAGYATRDVDCIYPLQVLRYGDADVLLTIGGKPGEACHGCSANLSAYALERTSAKPRVIARFVDFGASGTFGDPGRVDAVQLAGHDAIAIEGGGLAEIKPSLPLSASDGGAVPDSKSATEVEGAWHVDPARPDQVAVDYRISVGKKRHRGAAAWRLVGNAWKPSSGRVPPEVAAASGE